MFGNTVIYYDDQPHTHTSHGMHTSTELPNDKAGGTNAVMPECFKPLTRTFSYSELLLLSSSQKQRATDF